MILLGFLGHSSILKRSLVGKRQKSVFYFLKIKLPATIMNHYASKFIQTISAGKLVHSLSIFNSNVEHILYIHLVRRESCLFVCLFVCLNQPCENIRTPSIILKYMFCPVCVEIVLKIPEISRRPETRETRLPKVTNCSLSDFFHTADS